MSRFLPLEPSRYILVRTRTQNFGKNAEINEPDLTAQRDRHLARRGF